MICRHCNKGRVIPRYKKDRAPKYRCTNCRRLHAPKEYSK